MTAIAIAQSTELCDVSRILIEVARGIEDAVARLLRLVGDLVSPASHDPDEDMSGSECKRDSAQPSKERRSHG